MEFRSKASAGGDDVEVLYSGMLQGDTKMKGAVKVGSVANGTFTAERKRTPHGRIHKVCSTHSLCIIG